MTKSKSEIQTKSDVKRGFKVKGFKLQLEDIAFIEETANSLNISQNELVINAIRFYAEHLKNSYGFNALAIFNYPRYKYH